MKWLKEGVERVIREFMYPFYVVQQDFSVTCSCVYMSKHADPACKKCLGTGYQITIRKAKGYSEDIMKSVRQSYASEPIISAEYYVLSKYPLHSKNIIVDGDEAFIVHEQERLKSTEKTEVYQLCYTYPKKTDPKIFMQNFNEVMQKGGLK